MLTSFTAALYIHTACSRDAQQLLHLCNVYVHHRYCLAMCKLFSIHICLCLLQVIEKERLLHFADALRSKLQYFDELERISAVDSDSFLPLLERLDACITYVMTLA